MPTARSTQGPGCHVSEAFAFCRMAGAQLSGQGRTKMQSKLQLPTEYCPRGPSGRGRAVSNAHEGAVQLSSVLTPDDGEGSRNALGICFLAKRVMGKAWLWQRSIRCTLLPSIKTRDSVPIILTKMVGCLRFIDSCPFLVFSRGTTLRGLQGTKGKGQEVSGELSEQASLWNKWQRRVGCDLAWRAVSVSPE